MKRKFIFPILILFVALIVFSVQGSVLSSPQTVETEPPGQNSGAPQTSVESSDPPESPSQPTKDLSPPSDPPS